MGQPRWRPLAPRQQADQPANVPSAEGVAWTLIVEYLSPGKLIKIEVEAGNTWTPEGFKKACDADGDAAITDHSDLPVSRAAPGALIGRIGGSTADQVGDDKTIWLFAVGRACILQVPDDRRGALFLSVNDKPHAAVYLKGKLTVRVYEAL
jgi:hypothetical protein